MSEQISSIFQRISDTSGKNAKRAILKENSDNALLKEVLKATYEPQWVYHVRNLSMTSIEDIVTTDILVEEEASWREFLDTLYRCRDRKLRGNNARDEILDAIAEAPDTVQPWMFKVLDRHLNAGFSAKSVNSAWPKLISEFTCQLALPFDPKHITDEELVGLEPKLDGTRLIAFVSNGVAELKTRGGKTVTNFDETVGSELVRLANASGFPDCVFDGELMSNDFSATMSQLFRKSNVDASKSFFNVFDWMPLDEWEAKEATRTCQETREFLEDMNIEVNCDYVRLIERRLLPPELLAEVHRHYVSQGIEGTMVKTLGTKYTWKRKPNVMKLKDWIDFDLPILGFNEGTKRYKGHLGSFVVEYEGVRVKIERGFLKKDEAKEIWENRSEYRGKIIEVQAQEITKDGSLRFPKFVRFRKDRDS